MMLRRKLAVLVSVGSLVVTSGLAASPAWAKQKPAKPSVKSKLLSVSDMPTGWRVNHTTGGSDVTANKCLSDFNHPPKKEVRASVSFTQGSGIPMFAEQLATGNGEAAQYKRVVNHLRACRSFTLQSTGKTATAKVGEMAFPPVGKASSAFSMTFTVTHVVVGLDLVLFEVGKYVGLTAYGDLGSPLVTTLVTLTQKAVAKAGGASGGSKRPTTATVAAGLVGNAAPSVQPGAKGKLDVVFVGPPSGTGDTWVPVAIWNGTSGTVNNIEVSGSAAVNGAIVGSGDSQNIEPQNLKSGQVAFGQVYFQNPVPSGAAFDLSAKGSSGPSSYYLDAHVTQANYVPAQSTYATSVVAGGISNPGRLTVHSPEISVFCFAGGTLSSVQRGYASGDSDLAPHGSGTFSVTVPSTCTSYLVGASGYGNWGPQG